MAILSFLEFFAPTAFFGCLAVTLGLVSISPMSKLLRTGLFMTLVPFHLLLFFQFQDKVFNTLSGILGIYSWREVSKDFFGYHERFFSVTFDHLMKPEIGFPLLCVLAAAFTAWMLTVVVTKRYFSDHDILGAVVSLIVAGMAIIASFGLLVPVVVVGFLFVSRKPSSIHRIIEGKEALKDMFQGILRIKLKMLIRKKNGILVHPLLRIPKSFENRGMIIFGAPGSGKTHLIKTFYVPQFRRRGDMTVIFDYKGDFTENLGEDEDVLIMSPLDARSVIWDVAKDIDTETMAWEFGRMVVQKGDSPTDTVFEDWARDLITASLIKLQREIEDSWTFRDFYEQSQDINALIDAVKKYRKESEFAASFKGESKQFEGIKGTIRQAMVRLEPLARAWGDPGDGNNLFSIKGWLAANGGLKPTIVVRYDPLYGETIGPFVSNFLNFLMASVLSLPDAKGVSKDRRVWAVLDEFQILPKIPKLFEAARAGRSKGLRMMLGTQDLGQTDQTYKKEGGRDTLVNLMGFKLMGHLGSEGMQNFAAGLLSKNKVIIQNKNVQQSRGRTSVTYSESVKLEPAISPGEFGSIPLPTSYNGSLFWMVHQGWHPVCLQFVTKNLQDKYESKVDAAWLNDKDRIKPAKPQEAIEQKSESKYEIAFKNHADGIKNKMAKVFKEATGENIDDHLPQPEGA